MPDDHDEYVEISLDDDDESAPAPNVLDVSLDDQPSPPATSTPPPRARRPAPGVAPLPPPEPHEPEVPMVAAGVCRQCGYALRPLEETCPRCHRSVHDPVERPVEKSVRPAPAPTEMPSTAPELPPASPQRSCSLFTIAGLLLFLTLAIGVPLYLWMQPGQRAKREYRAGLAAQLAGDFDGARNHYRQALSLDPKMGLAAFSLGTTYLKIGSPAIVQSMQDITQKAIWGHTEDLDEADKWFQQAVTIGQQMPPALRLMDQKINDPPHLRAFAHACLAITALIRASAAMHAEQYEDATNWFGVASQMAQAAVVDDPSNDSANRILREIPTTIPGQSTSPGL